MNFDNSLAVSAGFSVVPVVSIPRVQKDDDLADLISVACIDQGIKISEGDVLVVAQKIVSKAEGAFVDLNSVKPSAEASRVAAEVRKDSRLVHVILGQTRRIVRKAPGALITETVHGLICANAGVDASNGLGPDIVTLLPQDSDNSAQKLKEKLSLTFGADLSVIISDSFNRPWREGSVNVAIGTAGFFPLQKGKDYIDDSGRELKSTRVSIADEIASAAQLVMGESGGSPVALVRGIKLEKSNAGSAMLLRDPARDLFR